MICILGTNGQVGTALKENLHNQSYIVFNDKIINDFDYLDKFLHKHKPRVIINAIAYTNVELAENEKTQAFFINADLPLFLANYCKQNACVLVHYSTDYVFDGLDDDVKDENYQTNPLNIYGKSKLEGDKNALLNDKTFIFRVSSVVSITGKNFIKTMLSLKDKQELSIIDNQIMSPTSADLIANITLQAIKTKNYGLYNLTCDGFCSWFELAEFVFKTAHINIKLNKIKDIDYPSKTKRPLNSRLDKSKLMKTFNVDLPNWQEEIRDIVKAML